MTRNPPFRQIIIIPRQYFRLYGSTYAKLSLALEHILKYFPDWRVIYKGYTIIHNHAALHCFLILPPQSLNATYPWATWRTLRRTWPSEIRHLESRTSHTKMTLSWRLCLNIWRTLISLECLWELYDNSSLSPGSLSFRVIICHLTFDLSTFCVGVSKVNNWIFAWKEGEPGDANISVYSYARCSATQPQPVPLYNTYTW